MYCILATGRAAAVTGASAAGSITDTDLFSGKLILGSYLRPNSTRLLFFVVSTCANQLI